MERAMQRTGAHWGARDVIAWGCGAGTKVIGIRAAGTLQPLHPKRVSLCSTSRRTDVAAARGPRGWRAHVYEEAGSRLLCARLALTMQ